MPQNSTVDLTRSRIGSLLVALALGSTACGAGEPVEQADATATAETQEGISGGVLAANNNAPFASAVKLKGPIAGIDCSGTKIGSLIFLTAGHCNFLVNPKRAVDGGTQVPIDNGLGGGSATPVAVDRFYTHPSFTNPILAPSNTGIDAGLLYVSQQTPNIPVMAVDFGVVNDDVGIPIIGYGCDLRAPSHSGQKQWWNFKTLSQAELGALLPGWTGLYHNYMFYDGGPNGGDYHQVCDGDSGGPAVNSSLSGTTTTWKVTGITVERMQDATSQRMMSVSTRTGPIGSWIVTPTLGAVHGTITNVLSGTCLSGAGSTTSGSPVVLQVCDPTTTASGTQFWSIFNSTFGGIVKQQLRNGKSGLCLDGGTVAGATSLTLSTCANVHQQRWTLTASATTPSEIVQESTGQNMGALGTGVDLFARENANRQRWLIAP